MIVCRDSHMSDYFLASLTGETAHELLSQQGARDTIP